MLSRGVRGVLATLLMLVTVLGVAHETAPIARAECDGGLVFSSVVRMADAAVVGRVTQVARDANGFVDVLGVRVERAYGVTTGPDYNQRFKTGWCADEVRVGSRVVLLIGVHDPDLALLDGDYYFVVGQSVTPAEVAALGRALPDTGTAVTAVPKEGGLEWAPMLAAAALAFLLAVRRAGARPRTPRPRTRAA